MLLLFCTCNILHVITLFFSLLLFKTMYFFLSMPIYMNLSHFLVIQSVFYMNHSLFLSGWLQQLVARWWAFLVSILCSLRAHHPDMRWLDGSNILCLLIWQTALLVHISNFLIWSSLYMYLLKVLGLLGFLGGSVVKNSPANAGDTSWIPAWSGRILPAAE